MMIIPELTLLEGEMLATLARIGAEHANDFTPAEAVAAQQALLKLDQAREAARRGYRR